MPDSGHRMRSAFQPPASARQGYHKLVKTTLPSPMTCFYKYSSSPVWLTCNFCTEAWPKPSKQFQAIPIERTKNYPLALLTSSTPYFLIWYCDLSWHNHISTITRFQRQYIPPSSKSCIYYEICVYDGRGGKVGDNDDISGRLNFGPEQDGHISN